MAILPMEKISICGLKKDKKNIFETLQTLEVFEVKELDSKNELTKKDTSQFEALFSKTLANLNSTLKIIKKYVPDIKIGPGLFDFKKNIFLEEYKNTYKKEEKILELAHTVIKNDKEVKQKESDIIKLSSQIEALRPWKNLDIPSDFTKTRYTRAFIGSFPEFLQIFDILKFLNKDIKIENIEIEIINRDKNQTCVFAVCRDKDENLISECFKKNGFIKLHSSFNDSIPKEKISKIINSIKSCKLEIKKLKNEILNISKNIDDFLLMIDFCINRIEECKAMKKLAYTSQVFVTIGYVPKKDYLSFKKAINDKFIVAINKEEIHKDENTPILLKNSPFVEPLESVTESYSLPQKNEIDPTAIMSIFYYILFGLMLSDAAYGFIITFGCIFALLKFKNFENSTKNFLKMFCFCGISTMFWGIMFGSYFGDIVDVISDKFFGAKISINPVWFFPVKEPMRMLGFSLGLGILHLFTGLGVKLYMAIKKKQYKEALYDVIFWYILVFSLIIYLLSNKIICDLLMINFIIPNDVANLAIIFSIAAGVGIILTSGRESRGFKRILKGFYALYNVTGYLSDILSYSRLLALGLATGVIASVFNSMAGMLSGLFLGYIWFFVAAVLGHTLNITINVLGAYVHTNRLQFVEFFGKFYEGGGSKFSPFKFKNKYYNIKNKKTKSFL
ncbi:MAG: V-type ATP synthase subunit I [Oscillospiraceae bacterium]|jgi:V/A-type H+-transporting ATPase subunit I|nr:V-type ATP synthase subunit I [Oscillospiraceae bacterium]